MFIITNFGKNFSKVQVLDTADRSVEELTTSAIVNAMENGLDINPMVLNLVNVKPVQNGNGFLVFNRYMQKRFIIPASVLNKYVSEGIIKVIR